ncbi:MAG: zonular occludens toxin domain-containing protein [Mycobacterium sp.]|uniref:zonular occludens toxin domain-containing protein n=1 Tax=Mycobacterium sp. TaxID=1785 RepID=UPI003CC527CD
MAITLVTGAPGHGKSYYAVRELLRCLERGKYVATNVELEEGWWEVFARANVFRRLVPGRVDRMAVDYRRRVHVVEDLAGLMKLRIPGCGKCPGCRKGGTCRREERGVAVLDEAHIWMNSRTWDQDERGEGLSRTEAVQRRLAITRFFAQHRKRGWKVVLIAQQAGLLDNQVRDLYEYHTQLRNLRRLKSWWNPLRLLPFNVFIALTFWHDRSKTRCGSEVFLLNKRVAGLYDTMATSGGLDDDDDAIMLGTVQDRFASDVAAIADGLAGGQDGTSSASPVESDLSLFPAASEAPPVGAPAVPPADVRSSGKPSQSAAMALLEQMTGPELPTPGPSTTKRDQSAHDGLSGTG